MGMGEATHNKEMEQTNGALTQMEAPFAAHLQCVLPSASLRGERGS